MTEFTGEVHWYAAAFPLLPDEELQALAADIAGRGLQHPIVLSPDGVLLDGRNRLAACELADVEPTFAITHQDPVQFITGENAHRRHLTAGQRAMSVAVGMFEAGMWAGDKWKYGAKKAIGASAPIDGADLKLSGQILAHDRDLALEVLAGDRNLREAYDEVQESKRLAVAIERKRSELATQAPDLLDKVSGEFTVDMAYAAYQERDKERLDRERAAEQARKNLNNDFDCAISTIQTVTFDDDRLRSFINGWEPTGPAWNWTVDDVRDAAQRLTQVADQWEGTK